MVNLAVINLKTLLKKIIKIICLILVGAMIFKFALIIYNTAKNFNVITVKNKISMIKNNIAISEYFEKNENAYSSGFKKILVAELAVFTGAEEEIMERENQEEVLEFETLQEVEVSNQTEETKKKEKVVNIENNTQEMPEVQLQNTENQQVTNDFVKTQVLGENNKKDVYTDVYKTVQIKNESSYSLTEEMVTPNVKYKNNKDIIIYHTHTCESYTPTENSQYIATGNYRTTDLNFSVARVGSELANNLAGKGYTVAHDQTCHDYPAYTGSYTRSLSTISNMLSVYKNVDAVFDIHRDALRK